jgi:peptidoglycan L-alanyl-D-glutamate endopeptidase CwlK
MIDARSQKNIDTLNSKVRSVFTNCLVALKKHFQERGIAVRYIAGTRTYAEQDALYAKGRTAPGPIVTKARGGQSLHNFGIAVDVGLFLPDGRYLGESSFYREIGKVVEIYPQLEWGGNWKFVDEPHIQWRTGLTLAEMRERVKNGRSVV